MNDWTECFPSLEKSDIAIALVDPETRVLFANEKMKEMYPLSEEQLFASDSQFAGLISSSLRLKKNISGFPIHDQVDGNAVHLLLYTSLSDNHHADDYLLVILCDISNLHQHYETKSNEKMIDLLGDMAAGTANIILNPLAVMKGTTQLIEKSVKENLMSMDEINHPFYNKLNRYFRLIYDEVKKVEEHLNRFIFLGKPSEVSATPISVIAFLQGFLPGIQLEALERKITLICHYPNTNGQFLANEALLKDALHALIQNAFEAARENGTVYIQTDILESSICFMVQDNGRGISPNIMNQVKMPFFTTKDEALGLGLSYCERVLNKMGGNLEINSTTEGTEVHVTLPRIQ